MLNLTQEEIISAFNNKNSYSNQITEIKIITTAVSIIFLTGEFAYKINKPLNLGFLDFSTLEKRKEQCTKELKQNFLISPQLYLTVVKLIQENNTFKIVELNHSGTALEYALKMRQLDPEKTMDKLLIKGLITQDQIKKIAERIFKFHQIAPINSEISSYGNLETIKYNWNENFQQTEKYINKIITKEDFRFIQNKINEFIIKNTELITSRIAKNKIKHCHGDFHSENVFVINNEPIIFDAIVFNQRFPCSDVIAEIAFMAMDLDYHGKTELSNLFIKEYQELSKDQDIPKLLNFYKCYRAYIRAKINCFTSEDKNLTTEKKAESIRKAEKYYQLTKNYAELI